jgi:hypothetical protein
MGAIMPEQATVWVGELNIAPSALASSTNSASFDATGYITNYSESGGEEDIESNPVFGGGNINKTKPRSQIEVSFDIIMQYGTNVSKFDSYKWGEAVSEEFSSAGTSLSKQIVIHWTDGTNNYTRAYNNCSAVTFEPESAADDFLKGTITFKLAPTTSAGKANLRIKAAAPSTMAAWS